MNEGTYVCTVVCVCLYTFSATILTAKLILNYILTYVVNFGAKICAYIHSEALQVTVRYELLVYTRTLLP